MSLKVLLVLSGPNKIERAGIVFARANGFPIGSIQILEGDIGASFKETLSRKICRKAILGPEDDFVLQQGVGCAIESRTENALDRYRAPSFVVLVVRIERSHFFHLERFDHLRQRQ